MNQTPDTLALGLAWFVAFLFSTTAHEAAHAWAALRLGDPTAYHGGQVSLNPAPHIQRAPLGMVAVPIVSFALNGWMFGWASAPYDPTWAQNHPRRAGWMALAGPLSNLALALLAGGFIKIGLLVGWFHAPDTIQGFAELTAAAQPGYMEGVAALAGVLFSLNLILFAFNLLPLPPLDGSAVLQLVLPEETSRRYQEFLHQPMVAMAGILLAWKLFGMIFPSILDLTVDVIYPGLYEPAA